MEIALIIWIISGLAGYAVSGVTGGLLGVLLGPIGFLIALVISERE